MPVYNEMVMEHFMNPRNVGEINNADGASNITARAATLCGSLSSTGTIVQPVSILLKDPFKKNA